MSERGHRWLRGAGHFLIGAGAMLAAIAIVHVTVPIYLRARGEPVPAMLESSRASIEDHLRCSPLEPSELMAVTRSGGIFVWSVNLHLEGDIARVDSLRERCQFEGVVEDTEGRASVGSTRRRSVRVRELRPGHYAISIATTIYSGGPGGASNLD